MNKHFFFNKHFLFIIILFSAPVIAFSEGQTEEQLPQASPVTVRVVAPTGLPAISLAQMTGSGSFSADGYQISYDILETPDLLAGKLISGETELAIVPTNLASKLYNKGVDVRYAGAVVWGILYVVSSEDLSGWEDLKNREIYMIGRGLTPDIVFRYLLSENGLDPENDVRLKYVSGTTELAPSFITGKSTVSLMPEPALSMVLTKKPDAKVVLDLQKEWEKASGTSSSYPQASFIVMGAFADEHPEFVADFFNSYSESLEAVKADPEGSAGLASSYLDTPGVPVIAKAIPRGNLNWVAAAGARKSLETYLQVLLEFSPDTIGGALPDDEFYLR